MPFKGIYLLRPWTLLQCTCSCCTDYNSITVYMFLLYRVQLYYSVHVPVVQSTTLLQCTCSCCTDYNSITVYMFLLYRLQLYYSVHVPVVQSTTLLQCTCSCCTEYNSITVYMFLLYRVQLYYSVHVPVVQSTTLLQCTCSCCTSVIQMHLKISYSSIFKLCDFFLVISTQCLFSLRSSVIFHISPMYWLSAGQETFN